MKSVRSDSPCTKERNKYPCLMKNGMGSKLVLLMTGPTTGTVVNPAGGNKIGDHHNHWCSDPLLPYEGSICLEND